MPRWRWIPNVEFMAIQPPRLPCYLVEWYRPELTSGQLDRTVARLEECATVMCGEGADVKLLMALALPAEEVLFGVFAACSAQTVCEACRRAGIPAERLSDMVDARLAG
jgi:hypothetical protein